MVKGSEVEVVEVVEGYVVASRQLDRPDHFRQRVQRLGSGLATVGAILVSTLVVSSFISGRNA